MRHDADGPAPEANTPRLPWADWVQTLPDTVRSSLSDVDCAGPYVYINPPARADELQAVRAELRRWSRAVQLGPELTEDMVLAVGEAVANAVEHAYAGSGDRPGAVTVFAGRLTPDSKVYVVVSDAGRWWPPPGDAGFRGRGVSMMKLLADDFDLHQNEHGTTVLLGWTTR